VVTGTTRQRAAFALLAEAAADLVTLLLVVRVRRGRVLPAEQERLEPAVVAAQQELVLAEAETTRATEEADTFLLFLELFPLTAAAEAEVAAMV
jgi:hypothetical protein